MSEDEMAAMPEIPNHTPCALVDPATIKPHPDNPNNHPAAQIDALCEVIRENGWRNHLVVSKRSGWLIKGHGRLLAAQKLGCLVPVDFQEYADEAAEIRDLVADNKIAELSMLSEDKVKELRARFKAAGAGWGDSTSGGQLAAAQFGKLKEKAPKAAKYPILIVNSEEEYRQFCAIRDRFKTKSDGATFAVVMQIARDALEKSAAAETEEKEE